MENLSFITHDSLLPYYEGKSIKLTASVKGKSKKVTWKSSNKKIATVSSKGVIKGKKAGTVTITAKANGVTAKCKVTVSAPAAAKTTAPKTDAQAVTLLVKALRKYDYFIVNDYFGSLPSAAEDWDSQPPRGLKANELYCFIEFPQGEGVLPAGHAYINMSTGYVQIYKDPDELAAPKRPLPASLKLW